MFLKPDPPFLPGMFFSLTPWCYLYVDFATKVWMFWPEVVKVVWLPFGSFILIRMCHVFNVLSHTAWYLLIFEQIFMIWINIFFLTMHQFILLVDLRNILKIYNSTILKFHYYHLSRARIHSQFSFVKYFVKMWDLYVLSLIVYIKHVSAPIERDRYVSIEWIFVSMLSLWASSNGHLT